MPEGDWFVLTARIPIRRLADGEIVITAQLKNGKQSLGDRPLENLKDLDRAYLHQGQVLVKD